MYQHHLETIEKVKQHFLQDKDVLALIIGGSLVKGWGMENSDVDIMIVVTDEDFARRQAENQILYFTRDFCDYPDGYVDGKFINISFLREVAEKGNEVARSAFVKVYPAFSHDPEIDMLLSQIPVYPEWDRERRMTSFYSQVIMQRWFIGEAQKRNNTYLLTRASADLTLFGGRAILAYNRILYPYHKWFLKVLEEAPEKPANILKLTQAVLENPTTDTADAYINALNELRDWGIDMSQASTHFTRDSEWSWRTGFPPIHDW